MERYFNTHSHTMYSNIRLLDCINQPKDLIDTAIKLGLSGIAITDHECLSAHMEVNQYAKKIKEEYPYFKIALGNEIYLTDTRESGQRYYHFILIAKDALGHKALRELSSIAWYNSYVDRRMERVPTLKSELTEVMSRYKGHVIATTACIGGEFSSELLALSRCLAVNDAANGQEHIDHVKSFVSYCIDTFGIDDFYLECAPSNREDQVAVNRLISQFSKDTGLRVVVGTDAHYLTPKERPIHKAYLNSKEGDREVDDFYAFTYVMDSEEVRNLLSLAFSQDEISQMFENSRNLQATIEDYSLERKQIIPKVEVKDYPPLGCDSDFTGWYNKDWVFPTLDALLNSNNIQERYWINECLKGLSEKNLYNTEYLKRLDTEADVIKCIGEKLDDCLFAYFNTFKHYIDLFWECGSIVGPGRGSATGFLSNYLLGITQLDPVRWKLPYWRFLNKERAELPDIDIDLAPSKRPAIFEAIRKERGEFGLIQVGTFGTEGTKSAILTACRGYRSEDYPDGIAVEEAQYMSSLIPQERGFLWDIQDVLHGNPEKDRKPVTSFIRQVNNYPGLIDIIVSINGLVNKRSSHASGVILYDEDPYETAAFMKTPGGDLITCYDLHNAEAAGDTKYDFLVTEISDKIIKCIELLQADNVIEQGTLREIYNKYLHPEILDTSDQKIWDHLAAGDVLDVFQFSTGVGLAIAKKLKPQNPMEMTAANAMMRLMSEKGKESQQDRYYRIKQQGIEVFDKEMRKHNLSEDMIRIMHEHCDQYYGCCPIQEQMMELLMNVAHFTLGEANSARKVVAKKKMDKIPELKEDVYSRFDEKEPADYFWENAVAPQLGYAFSLNHSLPYSFVGIQTIYLAANFNPIYWNTACLIVNSGATDEDDGGSTDYGKIAKAIGDIRTAGIKVSLADINRSQFGFIPDVENNQILFGLKGMLNVGDDIIKEIIANRPYSSIKDFYYRINPSRQVMISLIKGGAFDKMEDRKFAMAWYIWETCDKKKRLTLQNMSGLIKYHMLPETNETEIQARRVYEFNRYLKARCKYNTEHYALDDRATLFLDDMDLLNLIDTSINGQNYLGVKKWDKVYQDWMNIFREWINANKEEILHKLNMKIFNEDWNKYAFGTISAWEMEALCFYYHEHELAHVNNYKYGFVNFFNLPEEPEVEKTFTSRNGSEVKMFKLHKICGTCIAKNKTKSTVTLLTLDGVVEVKFRKEYFSLFDKRIAQRGADGVRHIVEKSWFDRGNMIVVMGMRSGDNFIAKKYSSMSGHQLYKIESINEVGDLILTDKRAQGEGEEE